MDPNPKQDPQKPFRQAIFGEKKPFFGQEPGFGIQKPQPPTQTPTLKPPLVPPAAGYSEGMLPDCMSAKRLSSSWTCREVYTDVLGLLGKSRLTWSKTQMATKWTQLLKMLNACTNVTFGRGRNCGYAPVFVGILSWFVTSKRLCISVRQNNGLRPYTLGTWPRCKVMNVSSVWNEMGSSFGVQSWSEICCHVGIKNGMFLVFFWQMRIFFLFRLCENHCKTMRQIFLSLSEGKNNGCFSIFWYQQKDLWFWPILLSGNHSTARKFSFCVCAQICVVLTVFSFQPGALPFCFNEKWIWLIRDLSLLILRGIFEFPPQRRNTFFCIGLAGDCVQSLNWKARIRRSGRKYLTSFSVSWSRHSFGSWKRVSRAVVFLFWTFTKGFLQNVSVWNISFCVLKQIAWLNINQHFSFMFWWKMAEQTENTVHMCNARPRLIRLCLPALNCAGCFALWRQKNIFLQFYLNCAGLEKMFF